MPSGQCGASRRHPVEHLGGTERIAHAQPRQRPCLGEAAQHHHIGQRVGRQRLGLAGDRVTERLVDHHDPAGPAQREDLLAGVQHRGRVGRVPDDDEIGLVGHHAAGQVERRGQHDVVKRHVGRGQCRFGLGERRCDQGGQPRLQVGQQREPFGRAGQQGHLVGSARRAWRRRP